MLLDPIPKAASVTYFFNWLAAKKEFSSGIMEAMNHRIKLTIGNAHGLLTLHVAEIGFYHTLGRLPGPKLPHASC